VTDFESALGQKACLLDAERVLDGPEGMLGLKSSWALLSRSDFQAPIWRFS